MAAVAHYTRRMSAAHSKPFSIQGSTSRAATYDAIIIGGGHNGLVCAAYLAGAGLRVRVLERRHVLGGAAVTEEFHPGFRNSSASYTVSLLAPKVIRDLRLAEHGLRIVERPLANFLPLPDGRYLKSGGGLAATQSEVAKFSRRDADRLPAYYAMIEQVAEVLRGLLLRTPPNVGGGLGSLAEAVIQAARMARLPREVQRNVLDLFTKSAGELLEWWFESEPVRALFGFDAVVGNFASPYAPGSAYVLLHHVFGEVNGKRGSWGHAIGGMGAITQAMAAEARARGAELSTEASVQQVLVRDGRAHGVQLADGSMLQARSVISNLNPKLLFLSLCPADSLPSEIVERMQRWRCGSATFRMNVALRQLPDFIGLSGAGPHHGSGIILAPSLGYMERAHADARALGWSRAPIVEMLIPSTLDDSLAPPGQHVASLFCQHFNPQLPDGLRWEDERERATDLVLQTVAQYCPGFAHDVLGRSILSPLDLEQQFGLLGGDIFHGALGLDQLWSARPLLGYADYRSPIQGLYLCGSGSHPGGGVTGIPGHNAAREILADFRRGRVPRVAN